MSSSLGAEAYNARWLTDQQVALSFVAPSHFQEIARQGHTLLLGPRGSGKTTLLRMLQPSTLALWRGDSAEATRRAVEYCGVFVPADRNWAEQVLALSYRLSGKAKSALENGAITANVLHSMLEVALWRASAAEASYSGEYMKVRLTAKRESELVREIATAWNLQVTVPSLLGAKHSISRLMHELSRFGDGRAEHESVVAYPKLLSLPLFEAASFFAEVFNDAVGETGRRWALMFDELEIAPEVIQRELYASLRSRNPKMLLKLAFSPLSSFEHAFDFQRSANAIADFAAVPLWFPHRDSTTYANSQRPFCEAIWRISAEALGRPENSAYKVLASSEEPNGGQRRSAYSVAGKWGKAFANLASRDASFAAFLSQRGIVPTALDKVPTAERDKILRKIRPLVAIRDHYRGLGDGDDVRARSRRKAASPFAGADDLFALSEGHPRWLKLIIPQLLARATRRIDRLRIPAHVQSAVVSDYASRFASLLASVEILRSPAIPAAKTVHDVVAAIAGCFHREVVEAPFRADPPLSFFVDEAVDSQLARAIGTAVNLGAIVYLPSQDDAPFIDSVYGRRFRISYWLAPKFGLPLVAGKAVSLTSILRQGKSGHTTPYVELDFG